MAFIERNVRAGPLGLALAGKPLTPGGYLVVWRGEERFLARTLSQGMNGKPVVQVVQPGWPGAGSNEAVELGLHEIDLIEMDWASGGDLDKAIALARVWDRKS